MLLSSPSCHTLPWMTLLCCGSRRHGLYLIVKARLEGTMVCVGSVPTSPLHNTRNKRRKGGGEAFSRAFLQKDRTVSMSELFRISLIFLP